MSFSSIQRPSADESFIRRSVDMSEFWGDDVIVYARPITTADHIKVSKHHKKWPEGDLFEGSIHLLTLICQNEDGTRFFDNPIKDRKRLASFPQEEIQPLLTNLVNDADDDDDEKPVKN